MPAEIGMKTGRGKKMAGYAEGSTEKKKNLGGRFKEEKPC